MIELARFRWGRDEWAFCIGTDREPRLVSCAPDRRTFTIVWEQQVGRVLPPSAVARPSQPPPWDGWFFCVVLLGEEERRDAFYARWRDSEPDAPSAVSGAASAPTGRATRSASAGRAVWRAAHPASETSAVTTNCVAPGRQGPAADGLHVRGRPR